MELELELKPRCGHFALLFGFFSAKMRLRNSLAALKLLRRSRAGGEWGKEEGMRAAESQHFV